ncbi:MAG: carbohydrate ABC transporter permease [Propionibacteriaceae bacterium]|jgi:multiple sugar transport system permease protein|nr:carbohydrate ABC transporter permease [Propionibacteriaceae bacterium]
MTTRHRTRPHTTVRASQRRRRRWLTAGRYLVLSLASLVSLGPLVYLLLVSSRENAYSLTSPADLLTGRHSLANYRQAWIAGDLAQSFLNSIVLAVGTTGLVVLLGSMMAYGFARFRFPGRGLLFALIVVELMVPSIMLIIPQFILARDLHLLDSRWGLLLVYVGTNLAFNTFLLRGFFAGVPVELEESMRIDGAGPWRRYWQLMLPLAKPALATCAIFSFLGAWDEYVWTMTIISSPDKRTLPLTIALFSGAHQTNWGLTFAASAIALIPVLVVFFCCQRQFVGGITAGALKS